MPESCLQAGVIHHAVHCPQVMDDNLPTCDRAADLVENDLGNAQYIFTFPAALLYKPRRLQTRHPFANAPSLGVSNFLTTSPLCR